MGAVGAPVGGSAVEADEAISIDPDYDSRRGYDPKFLGTDKQEVPLPSIPEKLRMRLDDQPPTDRAR